MTHAPLHGHFIGLADYNRWANERLYDDAAALSAEELHRDIGVYFKSLFATLDHALKVDRVWPHLLDGGTVADLPSFPEVGDFAALRAARQRQDAVLIAWIDRIDASWLDTPFEYRSSLASWRGLAYRGTRAGILTHLFNHQTHHRGQAHTAISLLGREPSALDILIKEFLDA